MTDDPGTWPRHRLACGCTAVQIMPRIWTAESYCTVGEAAAGVNHLAASVHFLESCFAEGLMKRRRENDG